jgi:tripartite-type tricarboxylate transporter receptor subunit TctC
MRITRRATGLLLAAAALAPWFTAPAQAGAFPDHPVTLVLPFPAGGATDRQMRVLALNAAKYLGQPIIVENRPGAGGTLAPGQVALTGKPDGYTITQYTLAMPRMAHMQNEPWHPLNDFTFIMGVTGYIFGLTVNPSSPFKTFDEYIQAARANPGTVNYGSTGTGSSPHLLMEELALKAKVKLNHVPFKGSADMQQALLGGHIMAESDVTSWDKFVDSGKMRLLVTFGEKRTTHWPDVPTAKELGYDVVTTSTYGLAGPKGMDPAVVKVLHDAFKKALFDKETIDVLNQLNQEPIYMTGDEFRQYISTAYTRDKSLIEKLGLSAK